MHICFHMFLFVWCRISLVVSVQPVFSIQNSESFTQTILSHLRIFTTNSFVLNAGKSRLGAFCRRRWLQPFPRVFCIKMNFTTDSFDSHKFFLICTSPQQFFHFFHSNSFVQQSIASTSRLGAFCRRRWSQPFPSLLFSPQHHSTRRLNWICH